MNIETTNFENFTADEYRDNLLRLGAVSHSSFVGKTVYYVKKVYGEHTVLDLDGQKFWSNPFRIQNCG
jgi:hypothetical protein